MHGFCSVRSTCYGPSLPTCPTLSLTPHSQAAARAGLSLDGRELRKRSLRITRVSVQQQAKVRMARAAAAAGDKGSSGHKKAGGSSGSSRGGPGGGKGGRGGLAPALPESAWQGVRTKGKGGGVRGGKAVARASGAGAAGEGWI